MKLNFTRKTWYFFLLASAAVSMLGGFAVLGGHGRWPGWNMIAFCLAGHCGAVPGGGKGFAPPRISGNYLLGVFVVLLLSKLGDQRLGGAISARRWRGPPCWLAEYERGKHRAQRQLQLVGAAGGAAAGVSGC